MDRKSILKQIQQRNCVKKADLESIFNLSEDDQAYVIAKLSRTRQEQLMKHLAQVTDLDSDFSFALSRKVSAVEDSTMHEPLHIPKNAADRGQLGWLKKVKENHEHY